MVALSINTPFLGAPGQTVAVPIVIDNPDGLQSIDLVLTYDTDKLDLPASDSATGNNANISKGTLTQTWSNSQDSNNAFLSNVDDTTGTIRLGLFDVNPLANGLGSGSVVIINFQVKSTIPLGQTAALDLQSASLGVNGQDFTGAITLNDGTVTIGTPLPTGPLDIDRNGKADALTDGVLLVRKLFGFTGTTLTNSAVASDGTQTTAAAIIDFINNQGNIFDIDGNNSVDALTDGVLAVRYLFGFRGTTLTSGAIGSGATRNASQIESLIQNLIPSGSTGGLIADGLEFGALESAELSSFDPLATNDNPLLNGYADTNSNDLFASGSDSF
jgi:hypothetical protein